MKALFCATGLALLITASVGEAVQVRVQVPSPQNQANTALGAPPIVTSGNSCRCEISERDSSACAIYLRNNLATWIAAHAPDTQMSSSANGRYYAAPFSVAASACAGHKVNPAQIKVHWMDDRHVILEWH
ncbi:hypothetical protein RGU70_11075 [Herbaspirillum sp. RTI4]|uniref:hypothetical protein n=1 Tax=Herbaspirillum sp. RTI4 TaxID=3048640 RepID=UPI002AB48A08|nr:hypothetical protein [Herbaspirillum sp. RTI4]MDY7578861.1 hypothetical protein [Herbaspirillum sp. RTI4]MEA9983004.1 hypothetical protein [Herbaspirillum sp. RTI4]